MMSTRVNRGDRQKWSTCSYPMGEGQSAPGLRQWERGDLFLGGEIDDVQCVACVASIGEGEKLAVGAHLPAEDHVAGLQLTSGRRGFPAADQRAVGPGLSRHVDVAARDGVFDAEALGGVPDATGEQHQDQHISQTLHRFSSAVPRNVRRG